MKKKKVKKEEKAEEEAPAPEPEPAPAPTPKSSTRHSSKSSKKAVKRSGSNVFSMFSTQQVAEFKEVNFSYWLVNSEIGEFLLIFCIFQKGFSMMDKDKDGILGKEDLRATWDQVGKLVTDKELEDMLAEAPGPVNFTQLLSLFATRMAGGETISTDNLMNQSYSIIIFEWN